jgi:hypothetical protein
MYKLINNKNLLIQLNALFRGNKECKLNSLDENAGI